MADDNRSPDGTGDGNDNILSDQNNQYPTYLSQFPENLRSQLAEYQSPGDLGAALVDFKGKAENSVILPGENATEADRAAFFNRLGRPEKSEDYQFDEVQYPKNMDETYKNMISQDIEAYRKTFHDAGITADQAKVLYNKAMEISLQRFKEAEQASQTMRENDLALLKKEWGNDYKANGELASRAFLKIGELAGIKDEFVKFMDNSGLGNNPLIVKAFHAIAKQFADDTSLDTGGTPFTLQKKKDVKRSEDGRPILNFPSMEGKKT